MERAEALLKRSAHQEINAAQYALGKLYLMGEGVPRDAEIADEWFAEAERSGHTYAEIFMGRSEQKVSPSVLLSATRLFHHMGNIFRDNAPIPAAKGPQIDRKRLRELQRKRLAMGHKRDDHVDEPDYKYMSPTLSM